MRRLSFALPVAVLLAGCVGTPADSPTEPTLQQDRVPTLLPPPAGAQYGVPAPFYDRKQDLPVAGAASLTSVVMDFEDLASSGTESTYVNKYSQGGFTLMNESYPDSSNAFGSPESDNAAFYQGSAALVNNYPDAVTLLTKDDGGTFNADSIALAELFASPPGVLSPRGATDVSFTGTRADGSTVSTTFTTDGLGGFETFTFQGFTDLVSLSWAQVDPYHQFDNINLTFGSSDTANPRPKTGTEDKDACMDGGWKQMGFKNQGQCVRFVETGKDSR
jgi:hypothetical protein